jgi:hypothetical protein
MDKEDMTSAEDVSGSTLLAELHMHAALQSSVEQLGALAGAITVGNINDSPAVVAGPFAEALQAPDLVEQTPQPCLF